MGRLRNTMVKKYAFLFPGQGSQTQGMMKDVCEVSAAARACIDRISEVAGEDITALLWDTPAEKLSRSDRSQLAITAGSLAVVAALKEKGIEPSACAGFSLGEFPALCTSGVLSFEDTIRVVKQRGEIMQKICDEIAVRSAGRVPGRKRLPLGQRSGGNGRPGIKGAAGSSGQYRGKPEENRGRPAVSRRFCCAGSAY